MAMIRCDECGREVSDMSYTCPSCGRDVRALKEDGKSCGNCSYNDDCNRTYGIKGYPCLHYHAYFDYDD